MRLLVLGASGGCGRWVVRLAVEAGHAVTAIVRPESPFDAPPSVRVIRGSALDPQVLRRAAEGCDRVISCLGPRRVNPSNPWSPLRPPLGVATSSARVAASVLEGRRFVAISAAGVGDSRPLVNAPMRALLRWSTIGAMYADLESMETVLRASSLDWTAVRPVTLVSSSRRREVKPVLRFRATSVVGRADVAAWMLRSGAGAGAEGERTPMVGWW